MKRPILFAAVSLAVMAATGMLQAQQIPGFKGKPKAVELKLSEKEVKALADAYEKYLEAENTQKLSKVAHAALAVDEVAEPIKKEMVKQLRVIPAGANIQAMPLRKKLNEKPMVAFEIFKDQDGEKAQSAVVLILTLKEGRVEKHEAFYIEREGQ